MAENKKSKLKFDSKSSSGSNDKSKDKKDILEDKSKDKDTTDSKNSKNSKLKFDNTESTKTKNNETSYVNNNVNKNFNKKNDKIIYSSSRKKYNKARIKYSKLKNKYDKSELKYSDLKEKYEPKYNKKLYEKAGNNAKLKFSDNTDKLKSDEYTLKKPKTIGEKATSSVAKLTQKEFNKQFYKTLYSNKDNDYVEKEMSKVHEDTEKTYKVVKNVRNFSNERKLVKLKRAEKQVFKYEKKLHKAEVKLHNAGSKLSGQQKSFNLFNSTGINVFSNKDIQNQFIKRNNAKKFRANMITEQVRIIEVAQQTIKKAVAKAIANISAKIMSIVLPFIITIIPILLLAGLIMGLLSFLIVATPAFDTVIIGSYPSETEDILEVEAYYQSLQGGTQDDISQTPTDFPDYDEYAFAGDEIEHDPHELAAFLTAKYGDYSLTDEIMELLEEILLAQFVIEREESTRLDPVNIPVLDAEGNQLYNPDGTPQTVPGEVEVTILTTTVTKIPMTEVARAYLTDDQYEHFLILLESQGNRPDLFEDTGTVTLESPTIVTSHFMMTNNSFARTLSVGEQYIGMPYVWGGSSPETGFDCSGFISYILNESNVASFPRTTAQGLYNMSTPIENGKQTAGDLVFFQGTYNTNSTVTHVGLYVGNGVMLHCGDPIGYVTINGSSYADYFYGFGRIG